MTEGPAGGTATAAGALQIGDRVTWLTGWNYGEPSKIVKVRELDDLPGYVEITEAPRWFTLTSYRPARLRKDRLVARVIARTCDPDARIRSRTGKAGLLMHAYPRPVRGRQHATATCPPASGHRTGGRPS